MAGYSKRSLSAKLGVKEGMKMTLVNPPDSYLESLELPQTVRVLGRLGPNRDFIQAFFDRTSKLERSLPRLRDSLTSDGMLWISWPKKASGVETDLDGNVVRRLGLRSGLVDVKVCAVDDVWSGLKFVFRLEDRKS